MDNALSLGGVVTGVDEYLKVMLEEICKRYHEVKFIAQNIQAAHLRLPASFSPKYSIAKFVGLKKANTQKV